MADKKDVMASEMTMLDYFAGEVLSGAMARQRISKDILDEWAAYAYKAADAMMKARNGNSEGKDNGPADAEDD